MKNIQTKPTNSPAQKKSKPKTGRATSTNAKTKATYDKGLKVLKKKN